MRAKGTSEALIGYHFATSTQKLEPAVSFPVNGWPRRAPYVGGSIACASSASAFECFGTGIGQAIFFLGCDWSV